MKKIRVILFDIDGVLITPPYYFSKVLEERKYENAVEVLNLYYQNENKLCLEGKADIAGSIKPYLMRIGWDSTSEEYLEQQFEFESNYINGHLLSRIEELRRDGIKCYLCTDQEIHRAGFLLKNLNFEKKFDGYFISCNVGYRKIQREFWVSLMESLAKHMPGIKAEQILFTDDIKGNITVASGFAIITHLFESNKNLDHFLRIST